MGVGRSLQLRATLLPSCVPQPGLNYYSKKLNPPDTKHACPLQAATARGPREEAEAAVQAAARVLRAAASAWTAAGHDLRQLVGAVVERALRMPEQARLPVLAALQQALPQVRRPALPGHIHWCMTSFPGVLSHCLEWIIACVGRKCCCAGGRLAGHV